MAQQKKTFQFIFNLFIMTMVILPPRQMEKAKNHFGSCFFLYFCTENKMKLNKKNCRFLLEEKVQMRFRAFVVIIIKQKQY